MNQKKVRFTARILSAVIAAVTAFSSVSVPAMADNSKGVASVRYVDKDKNILVGNDSETIKKRVGISTIVYDGKTYYDVYGGIKPSSINASNFLRSMLTTPTELEYNENGTAVKTKGSILDRWSRVAQNVLVANSHYSMNESSSYFTDTSSMSADRCCISRDLALLNSQSAGSKSHDYTYATGLMSTNKLSNVRNEAGAVTARGIDHRCSGSDILKNSSESGYPDALSVLKNDTEQQVFYSLITCINRQGGTFKYEYQTFGLAFYDLKLHILAPEGLNFITAATPYDSLDEASAKSPNVRYVSSQADDNLSIDYFENESKEPANVSMQFSEKKSESVSNTMTTTKTNTYSEMIGGKVTFGTGFAKGPGWQVELSASFTLSQALSTAYAEQKTASHEVNNQIGTALTLPPHTAASMETSSKTTLLEMAYDCPVMLTYKTAIFALAGEVYDDNAACVYFNTSQYDHEFFQTVFGAENAGGSNAVDNLYNRSVLHKGDANFEASYGNTYGYYELQDDGDNPDTINGINWENVLNGENPYHPAVTPNTTVNIEYVEVDREGNIIPYQASILTDSRDDIPEDFETAISAKETYRKGEDTYALYEGKVFDPLDRDGKAKDLNEDLKGASKYIAPFSHKAAYSIATQMGYEGNDAEARAQALMIQTRYVRFYYTKVAPTMSFSLDEDSDLASPQPAADPVVKDLTIGNAITWLSTFIPMASDGAEINYSAKNYTSCLGEIVPLYPLHSTEITSATKEYNLITGDTVNLSDIHVNGYNSSHVGFYGFDEKKGYWMVVDKNGVPLIKVGDEITDAESGGTQIVSFDKDPFTGNTILRAGTEGGTVYLKYQILDDTYICKDASEYATNGKVTPAMVRVNVSPKQFDGTVHAEGTLTGFVDKPIELNNQTSLKGYALDSSGKKISGAAIQWESRMDKEDGIEITDGTILNFSKAGSYEIRVVYQGHYSDWITVTAQEKCQVTTLDITDDNHILDPFVLNETEGNDKINLDNLVLNGVYDQYGNPWTETPEIVKPRLEWYVNGTIVERDPENQQAIYTVPEGGNYEIQAKYHYEEPDSTEIMEAVSSVFELQVEAPAHLASLTIQSDVLDNGLGVGEAYALDLSDSSVVQITALDQYGNPIPVKPEELVWSTGGKYSEVTDGKLQGLVTGSDTLTLTIGEMTSNAISYQVYLKPYVTELYTIKSDKNAVREGEVFDLTQVEFQAKDMNGSLYTLSEKEKNEITWKLTDNGTIKTTTGIDFDADAKTLMIPEGTLDYGKTGNVILEAEFTNVNGVKAVASNVEIRVQQKPVPDSLTLTRIQETDIRTGENALLEDFFQVTALDQYGENYSLEKSYVTYVSDNEASILVSNKQNDSYRYLNGGVITAGKSDTTANVTAQVAGVGETIVTSNAVELSVPRVRKLTSVIFTNIPDAAAFGSQMNLSELGAVCLDEKGIAFTEEELQAYPADISYTLSAGATKASLDTASNILSAGTRAGYITVNAMAVNSSTNYVYNNAEGDAVESSATIWVGPQVSSITTEKSSLAANEKTVTATLSGICMTDKMNIVLLDEDGNVLSSVQTSGTASTQTGEVTLPETADPSIDHSYILTCDIGESGEGALINPPECSITVRKEEKPAPDPTPDPKPDPTPDPETETETQQSETPQTETETESDTPTPSPVLSVGKIYQTGLYRYKVLTYNEKKQTATVSVVGFKKGKYQKQTVIKDTVKINGVSCKVTEVGAKAFLGNNKIQTVKIGAYVKKINASAFRECNNLTNLVTGNRVEIIASYAFYKCPKLKYVTFGKNLTTILSHAFCKDVNLKKLTFKGTKVTKIGVTHVFQQCGRVRVAMPTTRVKRYKNLLKKAGLTNLVVVQ